MSEKKIKNLFLFLGLICITLFFGLRYDVGVDYMAYYNNALYKSFSEPQSGTGEVFEPGFQLFYKINDFFQFPSWFVFILFGFTINFLLFKSIENYSDNYLLSFFVYFANGIFFNTLNGVRQFIAVMIVFYGYKYCYQKKLLKWVIFIIIAATIHKSAIIILPLYFFSNFKFKKITINLILLLTVIFKQFNTGNILKFIIGIFPPPYNGYADALDLLKNGGSGLVSYVFVLICLILNNSRQREIFYANSKYVVCFNYFVVATFFLNVFYEYFVVTRIMEYLLPSLMILYPLFHKLSKKNKNTYVLFILTSVFLILNLLKIIFFSPPETKLIYQSIFKGF